MFEKIDAMVVDPNGQSRTKLKDAARHTNVYQKVYTFPALEQAVSQLQSAHPFDIIFLSNQFEAAEITDFIPKAKTLPGGLDAAFVMLYPHSEEDISTIAHKLLSGADGFIMEPFSVDTVAEAIHIASRVKKRNAAARLAAACSMLINSSIDAIDDRADAIAIGKDRPFPKSLMDTRKELLMTGPDARQTFVDAVIEAYTQIDKPRRSLKTSTASGYAGVSDRVRKRMEMKQAAKAAETKEEATKTEESKDGE